MCGPLITVNKVVIHGHRFPFEDIDDVTFLADAGIRAYTDALDYTPTPAPAAAPPTSRSPGGCRPAAPPYPLETTR